MADDGFDRLYESLQGEPSADFAARLRRRLEDEVATIGAGDGTESAPASTVDVVVLDDRRDEAGDGRRSRVLALAAAVVVAVIAVGVGVLIAGDDDGEAERFETPGPGVTATTLPDPQGTATVPPPSTTAAASATPGLVPTGTWSVIPAPPCDLPGDIAADPDGSVWYGSDAGVYRWTGEDWEWFTHDDGIPTSPGFDPVGPVRSGGPCGADNVSPGVSVAVGAEGVVWIAASDHGGIGGVASFDGQRFVVADPLPAWVAWISDLWVDDDGGVWVAAASDSGESADGTTTHLGMARLGSDGTWQEFPLDTGLAIFDYRPAVGPTGEAAFVSSGEVVQLADGQWEATELGPSTLSIGDVAIDEDGTLWVLGFDASGTTGLVRLGSGTWDPVPPGGPTLFSSGLLAIDGEVWAPTWFAAGQEPEDCCGLPGLARYDGSAWSEHPIDADVESAARPQSPFVMSGAGGLVWVTGPYSPVGSYRAS